MFSFLSALMLALFPGQSCLPPASAGDPAVIQVASDTGTATASETDMPSATAGPFATYAVAADHADYLEFEYGFFTRVIRSNTGWYYVIYW